MERGVSNKLPDRGGGLENPPSVDEIEGGGPASQRGRQECPPSVPASGGYDGSNTWWCRAQGLYWEENSCDTVATIQKIYRFEETSAFICEICG